MAKKDYTDEKNEFSYEGYLKDRGDAKQEKSKLMGFLKKRSLLQVILMFITGTALLVYSLFLFMGVLSSTGLWFFLILFVINLITAMWLFNKIGLAVGIIILLGVLVRFGALADIAMVWMVGLVYMYFSTRPTPIDFAITKGVQGAAAMMIYQTIWVAIMAPIVSWLGTSFVLSNLVLVYMLSTVLYVILLMIFLPLITKEPIPTALMNGIMMLAIEYAQVKLFGTWFFAYIMTV